MQNVMWTWCEGLAEDYCRGVVCAQPHAALEESDATTRLQLSLLSVHSSEGLGAHLKTLCTRLSTQPCVVHGKRVSAPLGFLWMSSSAVAM